MFKLFMKKGMSETSIDGKKEKLIHRAMLKEAATTKGILQAASACALEFEDLNEIMDDGRFCVDVYSEKLDSYVKLVIDHLINNEAIDLSFENGITIHKYLKTDILSKTEASTSFQDRFRKPISDDNCRSILEACNKIMQGKIDPSTISLHAYGQMILTSVHQKTKEYSSLPDGWRMHDHLPVLCENMRLFEVMLSAVICVNLKDLPGKIIEREMFDFAYNQFLNPANIEAVSPYYYQKIVEHMKKLTGQYEHDKFGSGETHGNTTEEGLSYIRIVEK